METVSCADITRRVSETIKNIGIRLNADCLNALRNAQIEESGAARFAMDVMVKNAEIAEKCADPVCQDTGMAVVFVTLGQEVKIEGGSLADAINEGVRRGYAEGFFRKSVLDPITRVNTGDNVPAVIHYDLVPGETFSVDILLKGFGSENMSRLFMLTPSKGTQGIVDCVIKTAKDAGGNPCPPIVLGVGIGGTMEKAAIMSKHALLRKIDSNNEDNVLDQMEKEIKEKVNALNVGPQGFGGKTTCLAVFIEKYPTHLAGLPVAVTVQCHAVRHGGLSL